VFLDAIFWALLQTNRLYLLYYEYMDEQIPSSVNTPVDSPQDMYPTDTSDVTQEVEEDVGSTNINTEPEELSWEASEYIQHHKPAFWYIGFFGIGLVISGLIYLLLHDWIAIIVVIVMFAALFVYGVRKPRTLRYVIHGSGISVGEKSFLFSSFRSFSLTHDQGVPSITFIPLQRFALPLTVYFAPEDADRIADALSAHLPYEEHQPDMIDKLSHYLRF
jgi:hypothetical protein